MRGFSVQGRDYAALIILGDDDFEAMEVVEMTDGVRGSLLLEFRVDAHSARLTFIRPEIEIPLLRASLRIFEEEFLEPRRAGEPGGLPSPP
ncbi:hypothetical protein ACIBJC_14540 [Streptomyces sp. NPDC050509]|uniref:hypothetical protein n=1 Tax=Streptomyces sp. NPDC050509 TaxID=3365620 RepID=UPI0037B1579B